MKNFDPAFLDFSFWRQNKRKPDFNNFLKVLEKQRPERPTLFEFFLNERTYGRLSGIETASGPLNDPIKWCRAAIKAYTNAGYDYTTVKGADFVFPSDRQQNEHAKTVSLNSGSMIYDEESFKRYTWPDPDKYDYSRLVSLASELPEGMKFVVWGSGGGILEIVIMLLGYDTLCYLLVDNPGLVAEVFDAVGSRLVRYYEICGKYESVGAMISNDDWGFNTQTMLSLTDMRKYVFPWHKKIVKTIHESGKPAILHSCGQLENVMDDIIYDMGYDAKHSFQDTILPVEEVYERWGGKIAILGGIDLDFLCRSTPEVIYERSKRMLDKTMGKGSYALGSGNSIPYYVPDENYLAMISAII